MNIVEWMGEGINDTLLFPSPVSCSTEWGRLYLHHRVDLGQLWWSCTPRHLTL